MIELGRKLSLCRIVSCMVVVAAEDEDRGGGSNKDIQEKLHQTLAGIKSSFQHTNFYLDQFFVGL